MKDMYTSFYYITIKNKEYETCANTQSDRLNDVANVTIKRVYKLLEEITVNKKGKVIDDSICS